jgi:hypothetical protein
MLRFHLKPFLERHHITAYQLARATKGKLSESTVYGMSRAPLQRIDLSSVKIVMTALEEITGECVRVEDLIEDVQDVKLSINPKYAHLLKTAKPATRASVERVWGDWTPQELEADEAYWHERQLQKRAMIETISTRRRNEEF